MTVKVLCPCQTKFAFDIEPENGQMPYGVACPSCGADCTEAANAFIQTHRAKPGVVRVVVKTPAQAAVSTQAASSEPLSVSSPSPAFSETPSVPEVEPAPETAPQPEAEPAEAASVAYCTRHKDEISVAECAVCGKAICRLCLNELGYLCSIYCRSQATARGLHVPVYEGQASVVEARRLGKAKRLAMAAGVLVVGLLVTWVWYAYWGSKPKVIYSLPLAKPDRNTSCRLLSASELLLFSPTRLALVQIPGGEEKWSAPLKGELAQKSSATKLDPEELSAQWRSEAHAYWSRDDIWVVLGDRVARFDRATGKRKEDSPFTPPLHKVDADGASIVLVSGQDSLQPSLTRISLPDGKSQTEMVNLVALQPRPKAGAGPTAMDILLGLGPEAEFYAAGPSAIQFHSRLLEERTLARQAMRQKTRPSTFEEGNISGANSMRAANDLMNDMTRESTGGVELEDASRYWVTLGRRLPGSGADWSGEVSGKPRFYAAKTVNLVTAGRSLTVLNKQNAKLWEAKLTYPVWEKILDSDEAVPWFEQGSTLYFYDHGTLTAFDSKKGDVRWRLTSVGISRVQLDAAGKLILTSTTAGPDSIKFSQEVNLNKKVSATLVRVDPVDGKVLWMQEGIGENTLVAGPYLYTTQASISAAEFIGADGDMSRVPIHYRVRRIDPATGGEEWIWYQPKPAQTFEAVGNLFLVRNRDEVLVLRFLDFL